MIQTKAILQKARDKKACEKIESAHNDQELIELFFSPQGIEFAEKCGFPDLATLREAKGDLHPFGIHVDAGQIEIVSSGNICLAGDTHAVITASGTAFVHRIVLMHGAKATICASGYAVLRITSIDAEQPRIAKDATVVVL